MIENLQKIINERLQFKFGQQLPCQRQAEAAECGLACLSMILTYHGHKTDIATLRGRFALSSKGIALPQLMEIASALDLVARPLRLDLHELTDLRLPCILHWDLSHFVVLKSIKGQKCIIHDPARGVRKIRISQLSEHFTGVALELFPAPGFEKKVERQRIRLWQMMGKVVGLKRSLGQIFLLAIALEFTSIIAPLFNQWVVDQAILTADTDLLITLTIGFCCVKLISIAIEIVRGWAVMIMSTTLNVQWLANLFSHLLGLPLGFFEKRHMGDIISRFNSIHSIQATLTTRLIGSLVDGIMVIGTITMMLIYSSTLAMISIVAVAAYIGLRSAFYTALLGATESSIAYEAKQQSLFMESCRGIQSVRLFGRESERLSKWLNCVIDQKNATMRTQRLMIVSDSGKNLIFGLEAIFILAYGAHLVIGNLFSVGMLLAFMSYKSQFSTRVSNMIDAIFELRMLHLQGERLADIALTQKEVRSSENFSSIDRISPTIELLNVSFFYGQGEKPVLNNVSLKIEAGESVAIVGPSGCGKTTLVKILLGIHSPQRGEIRVGGVPLQQIGIDNYRRIVGSVMQSDTLFGGTIADNISFFATEADFDWIVECARMAALHNEIEEMPMRYNTLIGDMGSVLSGGQKQRLLLARALFCKPKILILDEATSHLDVANERLVSDVIKKLSLTRIIVAHRKETIATADRVIGLTIPIPLNMASHASA